MRIGFLTNEYSQQRQREKPVYIYPVLMAMQATHLRLQGYIVGWNDPNRRNYDRIVTEPENIDFLSLPYPDRVWTRAFDKRYQIYGNYKYHPATHMQVADGCWHGRCTFCVESRRKYKVREIDHCLAEIDDCRRLGFKEIFDDSGTMPDGQWLTDFCWKITQMRPGITLGCNMRIGADVDFDLMKLAGFRMLLYGIESANQETLSRIRKGVRASEIIPTLKSAKKAGLEPHIAVMFGYPWETDKDSRNTLQLVHYLLRKGYASTAQASFYTPRGGEQNPEGRKYVDKIYDVAYYPDFWIRKISDLRNLSDLVYLLKGIRKGIVRD